MYASGKFNFPTSTGAFAVSGLGFQPQGVIMIYGNKGTVGSLLTGLTGPGMGISMSARDYLVPSTIRSVGLSMNGNSDANNANYRGIETGPISMQTDAGTASVVEYKASAISFDTDGFTLTVSTAAPGVRPVHWFAWGGDILTGSAPIPMQTACVKQVMSGAPTFDAGFSAWTTMVLSTIAANGFGEGNVDGSSWFSWGTAHYPEASAGNTIYWRSGLSYSQIQLASALGRQGFQEEFVFTSASTNDYSAFNVADVINALGPILVEGFRRHRPAEPGSHQIFINEGGASGGSWEDCIWWNSEGSCGFVNMPASGSVTVTAPFNFSEFEQVMFSSINGAFFGGGPGAAVQRYALGMLGIDDQGCIAFGQDGSFYQSNTECMVNCDATGYTAVSGVINGPSFTLTTTHNGIGGRQIMWHAWGKPSAGWVPQMYRWWSGGEGRKLARS